MEDIEYKNKTDIWHVFTTGHDEYFTPAEGGEEAAQVCFKRFVSEYGCARLYYRAKGADEMGDGDCIAAEGPYPG